MLKPRRLPAALGPGSQARPRRADKGASRWCRRSRTSSTARGAAASTWVEHRRIVGELGIQRPR
jgi:hypothetical protein